MPVVQRLQRLQPFAAGAGRQDPSAYLGDDEMGKRQADMGGMIVALSLLAADVFAFAIAATIAGLGDVAFGQGDASAGEKLNLAAVLVCVLAGMIGYFSMHAHYSHRVPFAAECRDLLVASAAALVLAAAVAFLLGLPLPRLALIGTAALFAPAVVALRRLARSALDTAGYWRVPVVLVGEGSWANKAATEMAAHQELGYDVVAQVATPSPHAAASSWRWVLRQHRAKMLVLALDSEGSVPPEMIAGLVRERVPYALLPQMNGLPVVGARQTVLSRETIMVSYSNNLRKPMARAAKIVFDLAAAGSALLVLAPFMLLVAALVGLDGGPVFFAHKRIGAGGRVFRCLKFRSMVTNGDAVLNRVLATDPRAAEEWAATHKLRHDPRVTWIGRILRKTSLDELPQLLNVLRLEMSLVGPRPIVSLEVPKYAEDIVYYYETRPGITGLWQVSGRSDTTYEQRVRLDSWYVKNWTLKQDLSILARTIPAVVSGRGAG